MRIDFRVTMWFNDGMEVSLDDWTEDNLQEGTWESSDFLHYGDPFAEGLMEGYAQCDTYCGLFYNRMLSRYAS
jgi:hypothetical protein